MIISQTPLRISLAGGGTDLASFYRQEEGWVISSAIDKYVFVIVKERFDDKIYINYSRKEIVDSVDQIEHDLVREAMRKTRVDHGVEITTLADIPSTGSGLGSSSSVTVGLLNALYAYQGELVTAERLAREACEIEIDILGKPIGKQDQYIAAYGGIRFFRFMPNEEVIVEKVDLENSMRRRFGANLLLFFTGKTRSADAILSEQRANTNSKMELLRGIKQQAAQIRAAIETRQFDEVGKILAQSWQLKKGLASQISNGDIDKMYAEAINAGALGGKISGAGGGGFLLLYCPREKQNQVREALKDYREFPFFLEKYGSKIIFNMGRYEWK
ncbi:MAG: GHMP kinase [candidate division KSB1 bacterium]|nr:GHMP kinase [candidate division KSB1 bacterium]MDZ7335961.1 GHMP kinase [candidate division KSB1 bacterium]MDZ7357927.1 GHMP kinase [candidate division KSB1 bacterium]MDZ7375899.1 GHMP kinase [candidate division KSB1 bacterium]MDZ7402182.1 GHMP kinase [candidate division KSB1 bacterium]